MSEKPLKKSRLEKRGSHKAGQGPAPFIVLVDPQMGENIGAAARAMLNFGLTGLRIVRPRDGWPNERAGAMAAGASIVIEQARVFDTVEDAVADCSFVLATTARSREIMMPVHTPHSGAEEMHGRIEGGEGCAILFGGERSGLSTADVGLANGIMTIPVNPDFSSLNLGQAVLLAAYEWGRASGRTVAYDSRLEEAMSASHEHLNGLFGHLEEELDTAGFFYPAEKKDIMVRNIRAALMRADLTHQEVQTFRGVIKALAKGRGKRSD